jgi:hypothetical protein
VLNHDEEVNALLERAASGKWGVDASGNPLLER